MFKAVLACALCASLCVACADDPPAQAPAPAGVDHSTPDTVFAAYSAATDTGDVEALRNTVRPSQREMVSGATGTGGGPTGYDVVKRVEVSADEVHLHVKFASQPASIGGPLPHVLVREGGLWYVDIERTSMMIYDAMGE
jgi:hypothetical protein